MKVNYLKSLYTWANAAIFVSLFCSLISFATSREIIVAVDGSGNYKTITEALNSIPDNNKEMVTVFIRNGIYNEKIFIEKNNVILLGANRDSVKIVYPELRSNWKETHPDDYGSAVINLQEHVSDIVLCSLTVHNNYGSLHGSNDHQFTIRGGGNRIIILNCNIISDGGDALSLWNSDSGMYYHRNCYFEGYVDYVCPRGWCLIENSKFFGHNVTASIWHDGSKNKDQKFVIKNSYFNGVPGFPLGRFHRDAQFILIDCKFSKNMADKKIFFAPSNPPRTLQWGKDRIYFYNCHGDSVDYTWHSNNLGSLKDGSQPQNIDENWVFKGSWYPSAVIKKLGLN